MNVYDTANKLAQEIKASPEYEKYKKCKEEVNSNIDFKSKIEDFEKSRYQMQVSQMQGVEISKEEQEKLENKYLEMLKEPKIKEYFDVEMRFNILLTDVNKIIAEAVKDVLYKLKRKSKIFLFFIFLEISIDKTNVLLLI